MIGIETKRLTFRQWENSDFESFAQFYTLREHTKFIGGIQNPEESWRLMASYIGHYVLHGYSYLAITEKKSHDLIGTVGLWNSQPWPEQELGYWLLPQFQGKGFGLEAGLAVKHFALDTMNFGSLVSYIDPENEPSKQLALRLGARYDTTIDLLHFGAHSVYRYK